MKNHRSTIVGFAVLVVLMTAGAAQSLSGSNTVFSDDIAAGNVRGSDLAANAVSGGKILNGSVTGTDIGDGSVSSADVGLNALTGDDINEDTLTVTPADNSVTSSEVDDDSLTGDDIMDGTVTHNDLTTGKFGLVRAYAWVNNASADSTPPASLTYNSGGGSVTVDHVETGVYEVYFPGLAGSTGNVQITGYGTSPTWCKVSSWSLDSAIVRCFNTAGAAADSQFAIAFIL